MRHLQILSNHSFLHRSITTRSNLLCDITPCPLSSRAGLPGVTRARPSSARSQRRCNWRVTFFTLLASVGISASRPNAAATAAHGGVCYAGKLQPLWHLLYGDGTAAAPAVAVCSPAGNDWHSSLSLCVWLQRRLSNASRPAKLSDLDRAPSLRRRDTSCSLATGAGVAQVTLRPPADRRSLVPVLSPVKRWVHAATD